MKRQTVISAMFLIAVFAMATIFAVVSTAQHPIALTEKSMAFMQHNYPPPPPSYLPPPPPYLPPPPPYLPPPIPIPTPTPIPAPTYHHHPMLTHT